MAACGIFAIGKKLPLLTMFLGVYDFQYFDTSSEALFSKRYILLLNCLWSRERRRKFINNACHHFIPTQEACLEYRPHKRIQTSPTCLQPCDKSGSSQVARISTAPSKSDCTARSKFYYKAWLTRAYERKLLCPRAMLPFLSLLKHTGKIVARQPWAYNSARCKEVLFEGLQSN